MDMMEVRRRVMLSGKKVIDTSPIIIAYDSWYMKSGVIGVGEGTCVTGIYRYQSSAEERTIVYYVGNSDTNSYMIVYKDNVEMDYWRLSSILSERKIINANSNGLAFTLDMDAVDLSHAYIKETGQIFFAGKNSPYYGYTNINDMPT